MPIKCHNCATDNLDGSEYCDECGSRLHQTMSGNNSGFLASPPPAPPAFTRETITPKPATPYTPPPPAPPIQQITHVPPITQVPSNPPAPPLQPPAMATAPAAQSPAPRGNQTIALNQPGSLTAVETGSARARLIIQRGGRVGKEFPIASDDALIGRWDADGGIFPDVDLDQDDPEAKVSRRHARIVCQSGQYYLEDLGSTNGTYINRGQRLLPGNRHPLGHNDEVIVGKTFLKFVLNQG